MDDEAEAVARRRINAAKAAQRRLDHLLTPPHTYPHTLTQHMEHIDTHTRTHNNKDTYAQSMRVSVIEPEKETRARACA
jgi:hypothetical protein